MMFNPWPIQTPPIEQGEYAHDDHGDSHGTRGWSRGPPPGAPVVFVCPAASPTTLTAEIRPEPPRTAQRRREPAETRSPQWTKGVRARWEGGCHGEDSSDHIRRGRSRGAGVRSGRRCSATCGSRHPKASTRWEEALGAFGVPDELWNSRAALVDPNGAGPRVFIQQVPGGKSGRTDCTSTYEQRRTWWVTSEWRRWKQSAIAWWPSAGPSSTEWSPTHRWRTGSSPWPTPKATSSAWTEGQSRDRNNAISRT